MFSGLSIIPRLQASKKNRSCNWSKRWTPEQQGAELSFYERRELMRIMYSKKDENDFFEEMIKRQKGKL